MWHVDKYKITFKLVINWTNEILQHIVVSSDLSRPGIIDARSRYRAAARRLRNTALRNPYLWEWKVSKKRQLLARGDFCSPANCRTKIPRFSEWYFKLFAIFKNSLLYLFYDFLAESQTICWTSLGKHRYTASNDRMMYRQWIGMDKEGSVRVLMFNSNIIMEGMSKTTKDQRISSKPDVLSTIGWQVMAWPRVGWRRGRTDIQDSWQSYSESTRSWPSKCILNERKYRKTDVCQETSDGQAFPGSWLCTTESCSDGPVVQRNCWEKNIRTLEKYNGTVSTHCATSRTVPGSIPGGVTGDFFRGYRRNHVPWGRLSLWKWVPGISPWVKAAGA